MPQRSIGLDVKHEGRKYGLTSLDIVALAQQAEQAGFESFFTNEDIGYDSLAVMAGAAQRTSRIKLGTAIVNVYTRSAMQLAMAAATLDELSGGRALLGLSIGHSPWNDLGHGIPIEVPVARLREYVQFLRKALSGDPFTHDGRLIQGVNTQLDFEPVRRAIPIYVAGGRPQMVKLAGEVADGLIMNVVTPGYISGWAADHFFTSAKNAGRDPAELELTALVTCCVADDREQAIAEARGTFVKRLTNSTKLADQFPADRKPEILELHEMIKAGQADRARVEASEDLVTAVMNAGNADDVWAGLQRYFDAGCTRVVAVAFPRARVDVERTINALAPRLAPVAA